jgi:streptomycin 6-kinase
MQIPSHLQSKIINIFGQKGKDWIEEFPGILKYCIEKWDLTKIKLHPDPTYNIILFAVSKDHGDVVLKLGVPDERLTDEVRSLELLGSNNTCKCFDYDPAMGTMLLERIIPGSDLNSIQGVNERIEIVSELISRTIIPINDAKDFPLYSDWLERAFKRARDESSSNSKLMILIDEAEKLFTEIDSLNLPLYFLHGDIHHSNILMDNYNRWRLIDPQGVIGIKALSPVVFIENQIRKTIPAERSESKNKLLTNFSKSLNEPQELIAKCFFIDKVLSICWDIEDGNINLPDFINLPGF